MLSMTVLTLGIIAVMNLFIDTYGVRFSLFALDKRVEYINDADELNQHIFNPEFIFRHADRFDSFLFGSSRVGTIDPGKISAGKFYNMAYSQGLPAEHLSIIKTFLKKGIKIKNVLIGLDEFSFTIRPEEYENQLLRIMHPSVSGRNKAAIFFLYFFRAPKPFELSYGLTKLANRQVKAKSMINEQGLNIGWRQHEKELSLSGKPIFTDEALAYSPVTFDKKVVDEAFAKIEELILLAKKNNFQLIFFFNPIYGQIYLNHASGLFPIKERLALMTGYYDFSGLNSVTTNNYNYYEANHYRYSVGDMIVQMIYGSNNKLPEFGIFVTSKNVKTHIENQNRELGNSEVIRKVIRGHHTKLLTHQ